MYLRVANLTTIKLVTSITPINNWFIHTLDVNNLFLHDNLQEDVYMVIPPRYQSSKSKPSVHA